VELSWTTFILEIVNFLVLVWILKRFLYKPVLNVIAKRRAQIEKTIADAHAVRDEANQLKAKYEERLSDWEAEKTRARDALRKDIDDERARLMQKLKTEMETEREKVRAIEEKRLEDSRRSYEETALAHGAAFTARLLSNLTDQALHEKLVHLAVEQLSQLPEERADLLRSEFENGHRDTKVASAFDLGEEDRASLEQRLHNVLGDAIHCEYVQDDRLKAGIRISIGSWILHANLEDELKSFAESAHERD
jgi:F-type H+-transporting ATPase subunit b